jgi:hypothetical protein
VCRHDETAVEVSKKLLRDLDCMNKQLVDRYNGRNTQFIFSGDLLTGKNCSSMGSLTTSSSAGGRIRFTETKARTSNWRWVSLTFWSPNLTAVEGSA